MDHKPTEEQQAAIDIARSGKDIAIEAFAGAGKTSTLKMVSDALNGMAGQYIAFNKSIATDAASKFPEHVACRTAHSLAFGAVGRKYAHRLKSKRLWNRDVADILGIDPIDVPQDGGGRKRISKSRLAGVVLRGINNFCITGDPRPLSRHLPYIDGIDATYNGKRTYANNETVRDELFPYLEAVWRDACDIDGRLPFSHNHYLKMWELNDPRIEADFILHDESQDCQPPGTMVRLPSGERVPIETIVPGMFVTSYSRNMQQMSARGNQVTAASSRRHEGVLIEVETDNGLISRYTPNHHCIVKIGPAFEGKSIVYLMRRGDQFRVGVTKAKHGKRVGSGGATGIRGRLGEEKGDAAWILAVFDDRKDALAEEAYICARFGIPEMRFAASSSRHPDQPRLDAFWQRFGDNRIAAKTCLLKYGREMQYPLITNARRLLTYTRPTIMRACNLMDGMLVMDGALFRGERGAYEEWERWRRVEVRHEPYQGPVYSLAVDVNHTYEADGIVTHNCNGAMLSIVQQQAGRAQLIWVGDRYQQIMGWNGAVNAMEKVDVDERTWLTQSFRFGAEIAAIANLALADLEAEKLVQGSGPEGTVGFVDSPVASLFRTNAGAVEAALRYLAMGRKVHIVGGAGEIVGFAKAALELQTTGNTEHANLFAFGSWPEVQDYVRSDEAEDDNDLKKLVKLIDGHGAKEIMDALGACSDEHQAEVILSTAHKSKGREWDSVRLGGDFPTEQKGPLPEEEIRLLYVAATRAKTALDVTLCPYFTKG